MFGFLNGGAGNRLAETLGRDPESANASAFNRDFNVSNFDTFGGEVTESKFIELGRFTVPSSTEYSWGYGRASNPDNQGYLYVDLQDSGGTAVEGTIRFTLQSATGREEIVVADYDTEKLDASKTDRTQQVPFPEQVGSPKASEDSFLVVKFEAASGTSTVSDTDSEVIIPVTEYDLS